MSQVTPSSEAVCQTAIPKHVGIIMDGNGRWASARGLPRTAGHRQGVEAVRRAIRACGEIGIETVTLFSFSSENWTRPSGEVNDLMGLLKMFIRRDLAELHKEGVKVCIIGARDNLPKDILPLIEEAEKLTEGNTAQRLVIAFNYGSRDEIARAARHLARLAQNGEIDANSIDCDTISNALDTGDWTDPELIIRTSGEQRLSNFLLWQAAYSEFVFLDVLWPDFDRADLETALTHYAGRDRRFGGVVSQAAQ